jgi:hypothetical protein
LKDQFFNNFCACTEQRVDKDQEKDDEKLSDAKQELRDSLGQNVTKAELLMIMRPLWMANVKLVSAMLDAMTSIRMLAGESGSERAVHYAENAWKDMPAVLEELEKLEPAMKKIFPGAVELAQLEASVNE